MTIDVAVSGIGMTPFGKFRERSLKSLGAEAISLALADAKIDLVDLDMVFVANAMGALTGGQLSIIGQTILRSMGLHDTPVFNIDNACASSSSAAALAAQAIRAGDASNVLVLGVEKLYAADRATTYHALNGAAEASFVAESGIDDGAESIFVRAVYPQRLANYGERYPLTAETLALISVKNRRHAASNPFAQYREPLTMEEVLSARSVAGPVTTLMCAPIGDGAAALVLTRGDELPEAGRKPVWLRAASVAMGGSFGAETSLHKVAKRAYARAGITPQDVDVAEVHDAISFNELLAYEALGFCGPGEGSEFAQAGESSLGGRLPVNPSGGLESRGHPVAATGCAQIVEIVTQLRGAAEGRQVTAARWGLAECAGGYAAGDTAAMTVAILEA